MAGLASLAAWSSWRQVASGGGLRWLASYAAVAPSNPFVLRTRLVSCVSVPRLSRTKPFSISLLGGCHVPSHSLASASASARTVTQLIIPYRQPCLTPLSYTSTPTHVSSRTFADASAPGEAIGGAVDKKAAGEHRSFDDARAYVRTLGLTSQKEWKAWSASGARPRDIPSHPDRTYKSSGWTSYGDFLGYKIGKVAGKFRGFEDARAYAHTLGLKSATEWEAWSASGARPHDIPSDPYKYYASTGWVSYVDFLGYKIANKARVGPPNFRSFEDARGYTRTLGLKSKKEWRAWSASGARPRDIPSNPDQKYKSAGWTSYGDFLGYEERVGRARMHYRSFEDARGYVHTLGLTSQKEWSAWSASGARPRDIPSHPDHTYKSAGWTSYPDFLGYKIAKVARVGPRMHYRSFEDARAYVRSLRMKSVEEWAEWKALGTRPHDIPSNPYHEYASSGWVSYGDFLGYAVGKTAGEYRDFDEARTYVHRLGLKSKEEWQVWSASGVRPYDIPSAPDEKYASSGWTSYGDFLGYDIDQVDGNFRSFEDARAYVRALGLPSQKEWKTWRMSGVRPSDIPRSPELTYKSLGWTSYGDFLGYDIDHKAQVRPRMQFRGAVDQKRRREYRSFEDARAYVHTLGLTSQKEWSAWSASGARPHDIPSNPYNTYKSAGWVSYRDFLGYEKRVGRARMQHRSFDDACAYARTLGLKGQTEWYAWCASGARPHDIPSRPDRTYKSAGWLSYPDFLGYDVGKVAIEFRSFEDARAYVHTLGLKSAKVWKVWSSSGARPRDIPSAPDRTYASTGWVSYGDFLGYEERVGRARMQCRSFDDARAYARMLGLKSSTEWQAWSASDARPHDIPSRPDRTYKSAGWLSYGDFLGYNIGKVAEKFRSFEDARGYVHTLGLTSQKEWKAWSASGARPHDIPSHPGRTYKSAGWTSYGDFLGYQIGKVAGEYRSFDDARAYVHTLGLTSQKEWRAWRASGARPHDIPSTPDYTYKSAGWLSYPDFLGYDVGKAAEKFRSFEDARGYVHTLGLTSQKEWKAWSASGARPRDIPSTPDQTYASTGWTSYGDFLGYAVGRV